MKRILSIILALLACIFVFSACNNGQEESPETQSSTSTTLTPIKPGEFIIGKDNEYTALLPDYIFTSPPEVYLEDGVNHCDIYVKCNFSDFTSFVGLVKNCGFTNNSATDQDNTFYYAENPDGYFVDMSYSKAAGEIVLIVGKAY